MRRRLYLVLLASLAFVYAGCDTPTPLNPYQDFGESVWLPDNSTLLLYIQQADLDNATTLPNPAYSLAEMNTSATITKQYNTPEKSFIDFGHTTIFTDPAGTQAVTEMGINIYRVHLASGASEEVISSLHLIMVSDDCNIVIGTKSPPLQPIKTVWIYDISSGNRIVNKFDVSNINTNRGIWLGGGRFAIGIIDSVGTHITIFDTTGKMLDVIPNASISNNNFAYFPAANVLYFRNNDSHVEKINLSNHGRTMILPFKTDNFAVTKDESTIIYNVFNGTVSTAIMRKRNIATSTDTQLVDDAYSRVYLSPNEDKIAYLHSKDLYFLEMKFIPFSK